MLSKSFSPHKGPVGLIFCNACCAIRLICLRDVLGIICNRFVDLRDVPLKRPFSDREFVFPRVLDAVIPRWVIHAQHTLPLAYLVFHYLVRQRYTIFARTLPSVGLKNARRKGTNESRCE